ncbi:translation initiation factor [Pyxidicoccus fallax]|uniref:Translation initiation factor n=1 Tax=Pyxidicoccus fallax TaxID=394095 RepID=A0A848LSN9_9BACT|nr:translation initiation factor [Pyxidicoccus fallax]NMO20689.1 translation initiation factor [Pyxidicoccus fallax]NPC86664.1 translation initiation factor [Pyxidicoccus fallax]
MGKRDKKDEAPAAPAAPFNNPFAALSAQRESLPQAPAVKVAAPAAKPEPKGPARAVVRMERKGRGGKEVTVVEHLELPANQREVWLKALKNSLGCGGTVEDDTLVLQGDQRERLPALLEARGVRKVTVG